ncbi:hypothetical protein [Streptomyces albicerus]|uniref:hypothetical protein n=1 Tax=Streptomyces albicerus TaxID=2569859 RepID=UPI00124AEFC7|nr:hypothetical protein [Streptomyces albicerus]
MRISRAASLLIAPSPATAVLGVGGPAFAADPTPTPTEAVDKIAVDTPSTYTTHAKYGVYRLKTAGYNQYGYANCAKGTKGTKTNATLYTPARVGWYIWETK